MSDWLLSLADVESRLPDPSSTMRFTDALRHGTMRVGLYAPRGTDTQEPHRQDEIYVVVSGYGRFINDGVSKQFGPHDVIFVKAGAEHRFVDFTPDFSAWVIFWGPEGGER
ncbi:mannose-6-phosphate isomerase-like protein (cupin superfamily) [Sphingomonas sp. F9_3S_D5_B_2]